MSLSYSVSELEPKTPAEETLVEALKRGEVCRLSDQRPASDYQGAKVNSTILRSLAIAMGNGRHSTRGIEIVGAFISGDLDLEACVLREALTLRSCWIDGKLRLGDASTRRFSLAGSRVAGLEAYGVHVQGSFFMDEQFLAEGKVQFVNARIRGDLVCDGATIKNTSDFAFHCSGIHVEGGLPPVDVPPAMLVQAHACCLGRAGGA